MPFGVQKEGLPHDPLWSVNGYQTKVRNEKCNLETLKSSLSALMQTKLTEYQERETKFCSWVRHIGCDYYGQKEKIDTIIGVIDIIIGIAKSEQEAAGKKIELKKLALSFCDAYAKGRAHEILATAYWQLGNGVTNAVAPQLVS